MENKRDCDPVSAMPVIDLTLAVNYLPAVECMVKVIILACALCLAGASENFGVFVILALVLNISRALSCARIFDGSAVQYSVLLSWFVNTLRSSAHAPAAALPVATALWLAFAVALVIEPSQVQEFLVLYGQGAGGALRQILPAVANSFFIGLVAFLPATVESYLFRIARSVAFASLCICWVYVVTVWKAKPRQMNGLCVFSCHALVARFTPVLYVHWVVAGVYCAVCIGLMVYQYVQLHMVTVTIHQQLPGEAIMPEQVTVLNTIHEDEDEDLEALLRTAKQQQGC